MSRARGAELALVAVCAVWGVTFVMVQDAVAELPVLSFLAWRFLAAAAHRRACCSAAACGRSAPRGLRAGLLMGAFLTLGYVLQTFALQHTSASNVGFLTGLFTPFTPLLAALILAAPLGRTAMASALAATAGRRAAVGRRRRAAPARRRAGARRARSPSRSTSSPPTAASPATTSARCSRSSWRPAGWSRCSPPRPSATSRRRAATPSGARWWSRPSSPAPSRSSSSPRRSATRPRQRTALILATEPAFAGLFGWLLAGDRLDRRGVGRRGTDPGGDRRRGSRPAPAATAAAARGVITSSA